MQLDERNKSLGEREAALKAQHDTTSRKAAQLQEEQQRLTAEAKRLQVCCVLGVCCRAAECCCGEAA